MGQRPQLPAGGDIVCANAVDLFLSPGARRVGGRRKRGSTWLMGMAAIYRTRREYLGGFGQALTCQAAEAGRSTAGDT